MLFIYGGNSKNPIYGEHRVLDHIFLEQSNQHFCLWDPAVMISTYDVDPAWDGSTYDHTTVPTSST